MAGQQEIERKFLVNSEVYKADCRKNYAIVQGYLSSDPQRSVRVRIKGEKAFLTIKGASSQEGTSRFEWEKEIPPEDARQLLELCEPGIIDKTRYLVDYNKHTFEVDEFYKDNRGLTIAEVELETAREAFEKPGWLGREVTGDPKYYNAQLSKMPFKNWASSD